MNLYCLPDEPLKEELTDDLLDTADVRIERIVSTGQTTDWYDQEEDEFVALLQGSAVLEYEGGVLRELLAGDTVIIKKHERHRVAYTSSAPACVWLCVFYKA